MNPSAIPATHSVRRAAGWLALLSLLPAVPVLAAINFQEVTLDPAYFAYERDVADFNGDGLNDLLAVQEGDTTFQLFLAPNWTRSTLISLSGTYRWPRADDLKAHDIDGDGDPDVIARLGDGPSSDGPGLAVWFENLDHGSNWVQRLIGNSPEYVKDIVIADFDRDGRPDVAMRMDHQTQIWLRESAGGWSEVALSHAPHEGLESGDLDGDGDPDLIFNGFWYATPNSPAAARSAAAYTYRVIDAAWFNQDGDWTANSCKVAVGDIDGDGRLDPIFSHSERDGYAVTWYHANTPDAGGDWTAHAVVQVDRCHNLQAADWDLDGDTDLLTGGMAGSPHQGLSLQINGGGGASWSTIVLQSAGSYSAEIGDIDNDGDADIVGIRNWDSAPTYLFRNNAAGEPSLDFWRHVLVSGSHIRSFGLAFPDADGDGDREIASGPYVYTNPGGDMTGAWSRVTLPGSPHAMLATDIDGDANADLIAMQDNPAQNRLDLFWLEATTPAGTAWASIVRFGELPRSEHTEGVQGAVVADLVPGGRPELVWSTSAGLYYHAIPDTLAAAGGWTRTFVAANDSDEGIGVADMDGDGRLDIAFTQGAEKSVRWAHNPTSGGGDWLVTTLGTFAEADWPDRCVAADLNGDGRVDVVVTEENSGAAADALACWWEQPATGPFGGSWARHLLTTRYTLNSLDAADFDRDGDVDLVLAEHRGARRIGVWANDGAGSFSEHAVDSGKESHLGGRAIDLDGDGDLDLVSIAYDDAANLRLWRNDSPGGDRIARPLIQPPGGVFDEPLAVTLSCATPDAAIWYTLDDTPPTNAAPSRFYAAPLNVTTTIQLRAAAFKAGMTPSFAALASFVGPKVRTPRFTPDGGSFTAPLTVTLTTATTNTTIRYTTTGENPSPTSPLYLTPLTLEETTTLRARAYRDGLLVSDLASATYTRVVPGAPEAHWRLDERFGLLALDDAGQHHGQRVGGQPTPAHRDYGIDLDGQTDLVAVPPFDLTGTGLTITAWIRPRAPIADDDARILSKATGSAADAHFWMLSLTRVANEDRLRFRLRTQGATATLIASSGAIVGDTWQHVAALYDGTAMKLYLNGAEVGSLPKSGELDGLATAAIMLGANPPDGYAAFDGVLDDLRVYARGLTPAELAAVMADTAGSPPPTVASWERQSDGFRLTVQGTAGHYFYLQRTTNLLNAVWTDIATNAGVGSLIEWWPDRDAPRAFFRTRRE